MSNKYKILKNQYKIAKNGERVYRIFDLRTGLEGGWIESESNLSQEGSCMVLDNAVVCGRSKVRGNSIIMNDAYLEDSVARDNAVVCDRANLTKSIVSDCSVIGGDVILLDSTEVKGNSNINGKSKIIDCMVHSSNINSNDGLILKNMEFIGYSSIDGDGEIDDGSIIYSNININQDSRIYKSDIEKATIVGNMEIVSSDLTGKERKLYIKDSTIYKYSEIEGNFNIYKSILESVNLTSYNRSDITSSRLSAVKLQGKNVIKNCKMYNSTLSNCLIEDVNIFDSKINDLSTQLTKFPSSTIINFDNTK